MRDLGTKIVQLNLVLTKFSENSSDDLRQVAQLLSETFKHGKKVLLCGNGGSAADSQHFAAELVSSFSKATSRRALPAQALTTDSSVITAFANDFDFSGIFSRQVEAFGKEGDVLIVFSTSGNSQNCIKAIEKAQQVGMYTVSFTGISGEIRKLTDLCVSVPSQDTQFIQEAHLIAYHLIAEWIEELL